MPATDELPGVGVVYDEGAATSREVLISAQGLCRPTFLCDFSLPNVARQAALLRATADVIAIDGMSSREVASALKRGGIHYVTTFSEPQLVRTAAIADAAGFPYHSAETIELCTDKRAQRRALQVAGVSSQVDQAVVGSASELAQAARRVGLPCVLKPAHAAGSRDAYLLRNTDDLVALESTGPWPNEGQAFVLETFMEGDPGVAGAGWGDYVSVETLTQGGRHHPICVTGKLPLAEPFRETGVVVPSTLDDEVQKQCVELAHKAVTALGITRGVTHTELKLTNSGPGVIEVNARVGGFVPAVLKRSTGFDLIATDLRATLGIPTAIPSLSFASVDFQYFLQPPVDAGKLVGITGVADVRRLDGVVHVVPGLAVGSEVDTRQGTTTFLVLMQGSVASHNDVLKLVARVQESVTATYARGD